MYNALSLIAMSCIAATSQAHCMAASNLCDQWSPCCAGFECRLNEKDGVSYCSMPLEDDDDSLVALSS